MTQKQCRADLKKKGYKVTGNVKSGFVATRIGRECKGATLNGLIQKVFSTQ